MHHPGPPARSPSPAQPDTRSGSANASVPHDWSRGPAKWGAAGVLAACAAIGLFTADSRVPRPNAWTDPAPRAHSPRTHGESGPFNPANLGTLDLNRASAAELQLLPRIGPALSARIVEHRDRNGPYRRVEDLDDVHGIGPKTIKGLSGLVRVAVPE